MPQSDSGLVDQVSALLVLSAACLLLSGAVVGAVASGTGISGPLGGDKPADTTQIDPSTQAGEEDLSAFQRQLAQRIQQQVESGAINLSDEQLDAARDRFNTSRYNELVDSYQSVSEQTNGAENAQTVARLQRSLGNFTRLAVDYREGYRTYTLVRTSSGLVPEDVVDRRSLARRLQRIADQAQAAGGRVVSAYEELDSASRGDFNASVASVQRNLRTITERQSEIRAAEFVETRLNVSAPSRNISVTDPLELTGSIRTSNGTAMADRNVSVQIANRTFQVRTDDDGQFSVTYRPVELPLSTTNLSVSYVPAEGSPFLESEASLPVTVTPADPNLTVRTTPEAVAYNETLRVSGDLEVIDFGVEGAPIFVYLDGRLLDNTTTGPNGSYSVNSALPASVSAGEGRLLVRVPLEERALSDTEAATTVTIRESPTTLSLSATSLEGRVVRVTGQLTLMDGPGLANRSVEIDVDGQALTTLETNGDGRINETIIVPESVGEGDLSVTARFGGVGTNLASSESRADVTITTSGVPSWLWPLGGAIIVFVVAVGILWLHRRSEADRTARVGDASSDGAVPEYESNMDPERLLSAAKQCLSEEDSEGAVRFAYAAARAAVPGPESATHWEFYRACTADEVSEETVAALREITEGYERASYTAGSVSASEAEQLVSTVAALTRADGQ